MDSPLESASPSFPFLLTEGNLGIPKKVLYSLYLAAILLFKSSRTSPNACRASSSVILLANSSHQTALNARKRLLQNGFISDEKELEFTEVLIKGSSDCARQSIIWNHRRWIFIRLYEEIHEYGKTTPHVEGWADLEQLKRVPRMPTTCIKAEFELVRRACEMHHRNYYAWSHWHFLVNIVYLILSVSDSASEAECYLDILVQEFLALRGWIDLNVSDYSAIHHLYNLGRLFSQLKLQYPSYIVETLSLDSLAVSLSDHAASLVSAYPSHESLRLYVRAVGG